ncbi:MAG TPA: hypothetical protein VGX23_31565 [Actinocrinis sp.]|nr:hypothetical protein [Actinocrinis sp.]
MTTETIRKTVPITPDEQAILDESRTKGSAAYQALTDLLGPEAARSEAATLHGALTLGLSVIRERMADQGYTALAAAQDDEDRAYHAAMRNRRRDTKD